MVVVVFVGMIIIVLLQFNVMMWKKTMSHSFGISYSGAGLLTPFHLGVSQYLKAEGIINQATVLAGSSGGALAAVTAALDLKSEEAFDSCSFIANECRIKGTRMALRPALDSVLSELIPNDAAELLDKRVGRLFVAYAQVFPSFAACIVSRFKDKQDLLSVLRASCNIPFYFNGNSLAVEVRGGAGLDGFFAVQLSRFGSPETFAAREVVVTPFLPQLVGLRPAPALLFNPADGSETQQEIDIISPALLPPQHWLTIANTLSLAFGPPSEEVIEAVALLMPELPDFNIEGVSSYKPHEGLRGTDLVYTFLFNSGVAAAHAWHRSVTKIN